MLRECGVRLVVAAEGTPPHLVIEQDEGGELGQVEALVVDEGGLDTAVGENGLSLSGGERQRLAMARVILKDAPIVILDEPTANLDPVTESRLLDSIEPFLTGRTVLLISHRRTVLARADRIVELRDGRAIDPVGSSPAGEATAVARP